MNRRQFLYTSAMLVTGCGNIVRKEPNHPLNNLSIVDTHQHLWNLRQFRLPWLRPGGELTRDYTMADYEEATEGLGITKAIYMEVAVVTEQKLAEAEHVVKICEDKSNPTCAAVIGGMILENSFKDYILQFKGNPYIKGVRHGLNNPRQLEDNRLIQNLRLLGTLNMSFDLLVPPRLIGEAAKHALCSRFLFSFDLRVSQYSAMRKNINAPQSNLDFGHVFSDAVYESCSVGQFPL